MANDLNGSHRAETGVSVMGEERSLLLTFALFAIVFALAALAVFGLAADTTGNGALTSFTETMGSALTPGI